ncbi:esterase [Roseovarius spongiae]|uniref:Esterase n=1 Tax=Roseovarius spongiae TaxID=2320272 RepID=A0A3A8AW54_9RHOB|nr:PHB depolymerase family esterase [Roseovarius spongiae]RKF15317.1 esterase [Roseovarius spongiae]
MMKFNVGAKRPAQGNLRAANLAAANDLVQRTLAQHGLAAGPDAPASGPGGLADLQALMGRLGAQAGPPASAAPMPEGAAFRSGRFACAAGARGSRTYVPASATQGVEGVVMMLHGCTQSAEDFAIGAGMNALAETHRLIVIYPQQSRRDNAQSCWNWFSPGDQRKGRGEPAILAGIAREALAEFAVPPERCFVAGLSAGGAMAMILARTYPEVFAAVGVHSGLAHGAARDVSSAFAAMAGNGAQATEIPGAGQPVRCILFHGTADATVHRSNAEAVARQALAGAPQTVETQAEGNAGGRSYQRRIATDAQGKVLLEQWTVEGLGHAWSGGNADGSYTDAQGPDASAEMVRFFLNREED